MSLNPRVSIVMAAYNTERWIEAAVRSVNCQSFDSWELLIVDDASSDDTRRIVQSMAQTDPRVQLLARAERGGVSAARNDGLARASGRYVLFLDSDDLLIQGALEAMVRQAELSGGGAAGGFRVIDSGGQTLHEHVHRRATIALDDLIDRSYLVTGCHLVAQELIGESRFDDRQDAYEDLDLWLRLAERGVRWVSIDRPALAYRVRPQSLARRALVMGQACCSTISGCFARARRGESVVRLVDHSGAQERAVRRQRMLTYATRHVVVAGRAGVDEAVQLLAPEVGSRPIAPGEALMAARYGAIFGLGTRAEALASMGHCLEALGEFWLALESRNLAEPDLAAHAGRVLSSGFGAYATAS